MYFSGLTHKNDVIEFCNQKIKLLRQKDDIVDRDSYILLWELMILLLRQNGVSRSFVCFNLKIRNCMLKK